MTCSQWRAYPTQLTHSCNKASAGIFTPLLFCCRLLEGRVPATWARYCDAAAGQPQHDGGGLHTAGMVTRLRNRGAAVLQRVLRR
jgi:hypothetical protein